MEKLQRVARIPHDALIITSNFPLNYYPKIVHCHLVPHLPLCMAGAICGTLYCVLYRTLK